METQDKSNGPQETESFKTIEDLNGIDYMDFIADAQDYSHLPNFEDLVIEVVSNDVMAATEFLGRSGDAPLKDMTKIDEAFAAAERSKINWVTTLEAGIEADAIYLFETARDHHEEIEKLEARLALLRKDCADQKDIDRVGAQIASLARELDVVIKKLPQAFQDQDIEFAIGFIFDFEDHPLTKEHPELKAPAEERIIEELRKNPEFSERFLRNPNFSSCMARFDEAKEISEETSKKKA